MWSIDNLKRQGNNRQEWGKQSNVSINDVFQSYIWSKELSAFVPVDRSWM